MDIDLVYLWVDGNDAAWRAKKDAWAVSSPLERSWSGRYLSNDELKYSLRSVEAFLPWIRRIFVVTDAQMPPFLTSNHPKLSVVDVADIVPTRYLPTFNSIVIESFIPKIAGLSEYYLHLDDDMFFRKPQTPEDFFDMQGRPIVYVKCKADTFLGKKRRGAHYGRSVAAARRLIYKRCGRRLFLQPSHVGEPQRKSHCLDAMERLAADFEPVYAHRFRNDDDIHGFAFTLLNAVLGRSILRMADDPSAPSALLTGENGTVAFWLRRLKRRFLCGARRQTEVLAGTHILQALRKDLPSMFCIQDNGDAALHLENRKFLEQLFPKPSSFERAESDDLNTP